MLRIIIIIIIIIILIIINYNNIRKVNFSEISKNLDTDLKIILLDQNNYVGNSSTVSAKK